MLKENFFAPNLRIVEKNHKFGAFADLQCIGKLAEILSDLSTAVVEYHPVPKRPTGTNSLPRHQLCDSPPVKNTCAQESKSCYILSLQLMRCAKPALFTSEMET